MGRYLGNYLSTIKNPQLKVTRALQILKDLQTTLHDMETTDAIKQEDFERQLEISNRNLISKAKTLDEEISMNNELLKENHLLDVRIKHMSVVTDSNEERIKCLNDKVYVQKKKIYIYKHKFSRWLKIKIKNRKHSIKELVRIKKESKK